MYRGHDHLSSNVDVDECAEGTSGCSQQCNNTIGSFECSCVDGYQLLAFDQKTCNGMYTMQRCFPIYKQHVHTQVTDTKKNPHKDHKDPE